MVEHKLIRKVEKSPENCSIKFPRAFAKACEFLGKVRHYIFIFYLAYNALYLVLGIVKRKKKIEARVIF